MFGLLAVFLAFAIPEAYAVVSKKRGDTLSENIRRWLGIEPRKPRGKVMRLLWVLSGVVFFVWFIPHIAFPGLW